MTTKGNAPHQPVCPQCGAGSVAVVDSRRGATDALWRRIRVCENGHRYPTVETTRVEMRRGRLAVVSDDSDDLRAKISQILGENT